MTYAYNGSKRQVEHCYLILEIIKKLFSDGPLGSSTIPNRPAQAPLLSKKPFGQSEWHCFVVGLRTDPGVHPRHKSEEAQVAQFWGQSKRVIRPTRASPWHISPSEKVDAGQLSTHWKSPVSTLGKRQDWHFLAVSHDEHLEGHSKAK